MNLFSKKPITTSAVSFFYDYARKSRRSETYKRSYRCVANHIKKYEQDRKITILSNTFDSNTCEDFVFYLQERNLAQNTIRGYLGKVKHVFRRMQKKGFDVDFSFDEVIVDSEDVKGVYLSINDLEKIRLIELNKERSLVRDLFIVGCFTGMRYSDYSTLNSNFNIHEKFITKRTQKTKNRVIVPIHPVVSEILVRHGGEFPNYYRFKISFLDSSLSR